MKNLIITFSVLIVVFSCNTNQKPENEKQAEIHAVTALEVYHIKGYSYVRVTEDKQEKWLAAPYTNIEIGKTYFYGKSTEIKNFESKELNKNFESILFVEKLDDNPDNSSIHSTLKGQDDDLINNAVAKTSTSEEKDEIIVPAKKEGISVEELLKNSEKYNNKNVTLKGKVTKYNQNIMGVNWVHIEDGTNFEGNKDITITTSQEVKMGDIVTFKGTVTLNKDFGAGYFYKVIVEKAEIIK